MERKPPGLIVLGALVFFVVVLALATSSFSYAYRVAASIILGVLSAAAGWFAANYPDWWD